MSKRKRNFRWVKWLIFLVLIMAAVVVIVLVKNTYFSEKKEENKPTTIENNKPEDKKTEDAKKDDETKTEESKKEEKAPQYEGDSPNKSENLTGLITYADVNNDNLMIRVNIDQFLSNGNCNLVLSRNGVTYYTKSVTIQESVTTSTCDGFDIPVAELPKGDLAVEINLESEGKSGKITGRVKI